MICSLFYFLLSTPTGVILIRKEITLSVSMFTETSRTRGSASTWALLPPGANVKTLFSS